MEAVEFTIGLNDSSRVSTTVAKRDITHYGDEGMFLDVEVMVRVDAPASEAPKVEVVNWKNLCQEDSAGIGDKFGYQRNDVN